VKVVAIVLALALGPAPLQAKSYRGAEVEALMCAALLGISGEVAHQLRVINRTERDIMVAVSYAILLRYVSGTQAQKEKAMMQLAQRDSFGANVRDFDRRANLCLTRFPPV
jgi:hypothetical protein